MNPSSKANTTPSKKKKRKQIIPLLVVAASIVIIVVIIVIRAFTTKTETVEQFSPEPNQNISAMADMEREKLISMLPRDYDSSVFERSWDNFIQALAENRAEPYVVNEFMLALRDAIADKRLDKNEADNLVRLMNQAAKR